MKKIILICSLLTLPFFANAETTVSQTIDRIQIQGTASAGGTYYYFYNAMGWGTSASCPNAAYAYIKSDDPGAKEMLQLGIEAKKIGAEVKFHGDCSGSYIRVNYMYFE